MDRNARRVVVTGLGTVNCLGLDVATTWEKLVGGVSGLGHITRFDASSFNTQIAGEIKGFDPRLYMDHKEVRRTDPYIQLAVASASQALSQARLTIDAGIADKVGAIIGSGIGGLSTIDAGYQAMFNGGIHRISPFTGPMMISNMAAGQIAINFGACGPNFAIVSACATGSHVVGEACEIIRRGDALVMIAGGAEAALVPFGLAAFDRSGALSTRNDDPARASRPFDAKRDGFVFSEGAAALVLEDMEYAKARGAEILAEVTGYGATSDAYHITAPDGDGAGAAKAMLRAMEKAGVSPQEVDYINAHGTSTVLNDLNETQAIKLAFGEEAYRVPVSSTKSMTGHLLGAAGVLEALICVLVIRDGIIPPTINYEYPDPQCDLDYVPNKARRLPVRIAMSNSFGFGGHNACLVLKAWEDGRG